MKTLFFFVSDHWNPLQPVQWKWQQRDLPSNSSLRLMTQCPGHQWSSGWRRLSWSARCAKWNIGAFAVYQQGRRKGGFQPHKISTVYSFCHGWFPSRWTICWATSPPWGISFTSTWQSYRDSVLFDGMSNCFMACKFTWRLPNQVKHLLCTSTQMNAQEWLWKTRWWRRVWQSQLRE